MGRAYKVKVPGQETRTTLRINAKEQEVEVNTRGGGKHKRWRQEQEVEVNTRGGGKHKRWRQTQEVEANMSGSRVWETVCGLYMEVLA